MNRLGISRNRLSLRLIISAWFVLALTLTTFMPLALIAQANEPATSQSQGPAPASREKLVVGNVHTDAVSAFLDEGELVLDSKADIDADGDGVRDRGTRLNPEEVLFHLGEAGRQEVQAGSFWEYLGAPGTVFWLAPQTQNHDLIWPGFSTEDPNLRGKTDSVELSLLEVDGPGRVDLLLGREQIFSSSTELPPWEMTVPQHAHMDWVFTEPGTYQLTFEATATVEGVQQSAQNTYTFVVGELAEHTQATTTMLDLDATAIQPGTPLVLTTAIDPLDAEGSVQFLDLATGSLLGHSPVVDGVAEFTAENLNPGTHRFVAEFVPTWSNDFEGSLSATVSAEVEGEIVPKPTEDDTEPVNQDALAAQAAGSTVQIGNVDKKVEVGTSVVARLSVTDLAGQWVSVWVQGTGGEDPQWLGWIQANQAGQIGVPLPGDRTGSLVLVVKDQEGKLVGWDSFTVTTPSSGGGATPTPSPSPAPIPVPVAPPAEVEECEPAVTLDHGHIDLFYVSAAGGKAALQMMEDVTGYHVVRDPETVLLKVKEAAYGSAPGPGGTPTSGYVLPLDQNPNLIWPGWDTNRTEVGGYSDVSIHVGSVEGPGTVSLYTRSGLGGWTSILTGGGYNLPGTIHEPLPSHTHAQWVFSTKGIYKLTAYAVATDPKTGKKATSSTRTYVFQVGDVPLGSTFCSLGAAGGAEAEEVNAAVDALIEAALQEEQSQSGEAGKPKATKGAKPVPLAELTAEEQALEAAQAAKKQSDQLLKAGLMGFGGGVAFSGIIGGSVWYAMRLKRP